VQGVRHEFFFLFRICERNPENRLLRVSKYKPENFLSAHFKSPAIHEFFAEMAKSAQNFAGQPFFELFGEVFSNVTLRLVSRNPSGGTGFRLVNAPSMTAGRQALECPSQRA
jgi:hypothetical protein